MNDLTPVPAHVIRTGGKLFDRRADYIYFLATASRVHLVTPLYPYHLLSLADVGGKVDHAATSLNEVVKRSERYVFLDSGVFSLVSTLMKKTGMGFREIRKMAPTDVPGYLSLYDNYIDLVSRFEDRLWGYVEIDIGTPEQKTETRQQMESMGFRPVPVYHPLDDGWDYFDYLAERYDRICIANGQSAAPQRLRILATVWERRRKYPYLWLHMLGMRMHQWLSAYPIQSNDASTWTAGFRYGGYAAYVDDCVVGGLGRGYIPIPVTMGGTTKDPGGTNKGVLFSAYQAAMDYRSRVLREQKMREVLA